MGKILEMLMCLNKHINVCSYWQNNMFLPVHGMSPGGFMHTRWYENHVICTDQYIMMIDVSIYVPRGYG